MSSHQPDIPAPETNGWFTRFSNWLNKKTSVAEEAATKAPEPEVERVLPFFVKVRHPKAGMVKFIVRSTGVKKAQEEALVEYVKELKAVAEPYDK